MYLTWWKVSLCKPRKVDKLANPGEESQVVPTHRRWDGKVGMGRKMDRTLPFGLRCAAVASRWRVALSSIGPGRGPGSIAADRGSRRRSPGPDRGGGGLQEASWGSFSRLPWGKGVRGGGCDPPNQRDRPLRVLVGSLILSEVDLRFSKVQQLWGVSGRKSALCYCLSRSSSTELVLRKVLLKCGGVLVVEEEQGGVTVTD